MILVTVILMALFGLLILGGRIERLVHVKLRHTWIAPLAFGAQWWSIFWPLSRDERLAGAQAAMMLLSLLLATGFLWLNRAQPGFKLLAVGMALNLAVMAANGGYMPITLQAMERSGDIHLVESTEPGSRIQNTKNVLLPKDETRLWILSDIFVVPLPPPFRGVFSPGDAIIALGAIWFLRTYLFHPHLGSNGGVACLREA